VSICVDAEELRRANRSFKECMPVDAPVDESLLAVSLDKLADPEG
jgi:hypothetical protein